MENTVYKLQRNRDTVRADSREADNYLLLTAFNMTNYVPSTVNTTLHQFR